MMLTFSQLNDTFRLVLLAKRCGSQILDNAESFDSVLGMGRFASLDSEVLDKARCIVKPGSHRNGPHLAAGASS